MPKELTEEQQDHLTRAVVSKQNCGNIAIEVSEAMKALKEMYPKESIVYNKLNEIYIHLKKAEEDGCRLVDALRVAYGFEPLYFKKPAEKIPAYSLRA